MISLPSSTLIAFTTFPNMVNVHKSVCKTFPLLTCFRIKAVNRPFPCSPENVYEGLLLYNEIDFEKLNWRIAERNLPF